MHKIAFKNSEFESPKQALSIALCLLALAGCADSSMQEASSKAAANTSQLDNQAQVEQLDQNANTTPDVQYALSKVLSEHYGMAFSAAIEAMNGLTQGINEFYSEPKQDKLTSLQAQWQQAHQAYQLAASYRILDLEHPELDRSDTTEPVQHPIHVRLDQHPLLGGYLDSVPGYPKSGLIHSEVELTLATLNQEHQFSDKAYVTLGFHALGFMLFGEDIEIRLQALTPSEQDSDAAARRQQYITLLNQQIQTDLARLKAAWTAPSGYFYQVMTACDQPCMEEVKQSLHAELQALASSEPSKTQANHQLKQTKRAEFITNLLDRLTTKAP